MPLSTWWGYEVRAIAANPFLSGHGIEIGAGASPHRLPPGATASYFDKANPEQLAAEFQTEITYTVSDMDQVKTAFPNGADFLIAHNVLEHTPSEIAALIEWQSYVREGGVMVLSMPLRSTTLGDARRLSAPVDHLLEDYLFGRDDKSFESREHSFSFCLNWDSSDWSQAWKHMDRDQFVSHVLDQASAERMDVHWHSLERAQWDFVVAAAAAFSGRAATLLTSVDPTAPENPTQGEVIYVYGLTRGRKSTGLPDVRPILERTEQRMRHASKLLRAAIE